MDLHGHVSRTGTFLYGNNLKGEAHVENVLFAKLMSLNSINFHFDKCNFSEANMIARDKIDGLTREGSSRVAIYKETGLVNCYTIETSFQGFKKFNLLAPKYNKVKKHIEAEQALTDLNSKYYKGKMAIYTPEVYEEIGRTICNTLLDYYSENPISRIPKTNFKTIEGLKAYIAQYLNIPTLVPYAYKKASNQPSNAAGGKEKVSNSPKKGVGLSKSILESNKVLANDENYRRRIESLAKSKEYKLNTNMISILPPIVKTQKPLTVKINIRPIHIRKPRKPLNGQKKTEHTSTEIKARKKKA